LYEQEATEKTEGAHWGTFFVFSVFFVTSIRKGPKMHPLFAQASALTHDVIGAAIEVHKDKGPGLLESIYEWCLTMELELCGRHVQNQADVVVRYKQFERKYPLRFDLLIDRCLFVEVKAASEIHPINKAQLLSYMKLLEIPLGLIINFNELKLTDGVSRLILPGANLN
jgi:GxxExxY protein